jgi:hypothetical protein
MYSCSERKHRRFLPVMSAGLQPTSTAEDEDDSDRSESEDFRNAPIYMRDFIRPLQQEIGSEEASAQPEEWPLWFWTT